MCLCIQLVAMGLITVVHTNMSSCNKNRPFLQLFETCDVSLFTENVLRIFLENTVYVLRMVIDQ